MGNDSSEEHVRRSAELQRLLDEAGRKPTAASGSDGTAAAGSPSPHRSPLRSSPPSTFPRRVTPAGPNPAAAPDADGQRRAASSGDPSARLRRSAMVRSSTAGARRAGGRAVPPSTRTAVARSMAGRWGPAGFTPAQPEYRPVADPATPPAADRAPDARPTTSASASGPPAPAAPRQTDSGPVVSAGTATSLPATVRPRQRRTLVLAGGVAAAVVAIVAVVSLGNRGGSGPAADAAPIPQRVVMVESTGVNAQPTVTTVTAQVSTVNGTVVALVPDATGRVRQLTVVTASPAAAAAPTSTPATTAPRSNGRPGAAANPSNAGSPGIASGTASPTATKGPETTAPATTEAPTNTAGQAPADPDDVATVVTGLTTLTGWVPVTTG